MPPLGKRASQIDQDFQARQRVQPACTCGRKGPRNQTPEQASDWHERHRAKHHPDWPTRQEAQATRRQKRSQLGIRAGLKRFRQRDEGWEG